MNMRLRLGCQTGLYLTHSYTNHVVPLHFEKKQISDSSKQIQYTAWSVLSQTHLKTTIHFDLFAALF